MSAALPLTTEAVDDPGDLLALLPGPGGTVWLREGDGMVGWGTAVVVDAGTGRERFRRAADALREAFSGWAGTGPPPVAFGSFTFDSRSSGSRVVVPAVTVGRRGGRAWRARAGEPAPGTAPSRGVVAPEGPDPAPVPAPVQVPDRVRYAGSSMPDLHWLEAVAVAVDEIEAGRVDKVVLARDHAVWSRTPFDDRALLRRLTQRFPQCWSFAVLGLVGASPELLVRRHGDAVTSIVLAGSAARGGDPQEDERLGGGLLDSGKDRGEHDLAVASVRDVLEPMCGDLDVDASPWLLRLANVQHLATTIRGTLRAEGGSLPTALDLAGALHPTAAVCGTPTQAALDRIRLLEGMDRGRYAGPVGWVDAAGDGEWCIALRCAELSGARARLFAGAGIVAGSLPEAELEETRLKLRAMQSAFDDD